MLLIIVTDKLLIQGEIHLMGGNGATVIFGEVDLMDNLLQRCEILLDRLVNQDIPVCQV